MRWGQFLLLLIVVVIAFLLLMPTKVEPVAWTPQAAPSLREGIYADNQRLKGAVQVGPIRQLLLRQALSLSQPLHAGSEFAADVHGRR